MVASVPGSAYACGRHLRRRPPGRGRPYSCGSRRGAQAREGAQPWRAPDLFFALTSNHPWRLSLTPPCSTASEESRATRRATRWAHKLASTSVCPQLTVLASCLASAQVADLVWCRDVGSEVGYYYGAATTWLALADRQPGLVSVRCVVSVSGVAKEHGKQTRHAVSDTLTCMVTHWACEEPAAGRRRCRRPHSG